MSTTVDQRVVEMRFDNKQFESNVSTTLSTLEKLKQRLNLTGAAKGFEDINSAAKGVNFLHLGQAAETVTAKFSYMQMSIQHQLNKIVDSAVSTGKRMVSALTIDPIKTGLSEYETQINAVQTILANTESKGTTLDQVNSALDQLNTYADKTIYNFTEMTRNIGTFTAAGVGLETSVNAIQGIANLAAVSGSSSQQASTAMYQLSQALSSGTVKLMDWNSVVNAGMGGQVFQDALKETAKVHGVSVDDMIKKHGSFRETLQEGWITADILTETLSHFTMAAEEGTKQWDEYKKTLMDSGYSEEQALAILKLSNTATDAATKVKTATQLWDTLKETAQSGWTQTWEIILGDFGEAKKLFSGIYETLSPIIEATSEARNNLLMGGLASGWKQLISQGISDEEGYRASIKEVAKEHGIAIDDMVKAEKELNTSLDDNEAFQNVLNKGLQDGSITSDMLSASVTNLADKMRNMSDEERKAAGYTEEHIAQIEELEKGLKDGSISMDDFVDKMTKPSGRENIIQALKNAFDGLVNIVKPAKEAFRDIFPPMTSDQIYKFTENIVTLTSKFKEFGTKYADQIKRSFKGIFSIVDIARKIFTAFGNSISELTGSSGIKSLGGFILDTVASIGDFFTELNADLDVTGISDIFSSLASGISNALGKSVDVMKGFGSALSVVGDIVTKTASLIWNGVKTVFTWVSENFSAGDIFAGLAGSGIFVLAKKLMSLADGLKESFSGGLMGLLFGKGGDAENSSSIKDKISDLFDGVGEALEGFTASVKVGSFVAIAAAIAILASAFGKISELDSADIGKSLITMGVSLGIMMKALNSMPTNMSSSSIFKGVFGDGFSKSSETTNLIKSGIALMMMAKALDILADAMNKFAGLSWEEIGKGLTGVGGGIAILCAGLKLIDGAKVSLGTSIAMLALAEACKIMGDAMNKFVGFSWDEIARGLAGMGGALGELVIALSVLSKVGGFGSLLGSLGILIAVQSLEEMAAALKDFAEMSWPEIGRGLAAMGGALAEISIVTGALGYFAGFSAILGGAAIWITVQSLSDLAAALKEFATMSWPEIGSGLVAMGGALAEISAVTGVLGYFAGFSAILGGVAIWTTVESLSDLAAALKEFAEMSWPEIGTGLAAMGGALAEVSAVTGVLGGFAGFSAILGGAAIWTTVQSLSDLAAAFGDFAEMSWDEIGRGLVAMGVALAEVSVISGALGALAGLPALLGGGAILLAVQGLGDLADALKKFSEMSWDEIGRGLSAMGYALSEVAMGGLLNMFSGFGASAISEVAAPLGVLADSVKKWSGVSVPADLGAQLTSLAIGIEKFTLGGWGANTIAKVAPSVGVLADSVKNWTDVTVAESLGPNLETLATGVKAFTFGGLGASALSEAATGVGEMADAVTKWTNVIVPESLGASLETLGAGVLAFTFGGSGASSLAEAAPGVASMADSVAKWVGVAIPENLGASLETLAGGVKAFTFGGSGAGSLAEAAPALGTLADSVAKWAGVTVPEGLVEKLDMLSTGVKSFTFGGSGAESISSCASGLGIMADSVKKWTDVTVPENLGTNLSTLATGVKSFTFGGSGAETLSVAATGVGAMADSVSKWSDLTIPEGFSENLNSLSSAVKDICGIDDISGAVSEISNLAFETSNLAGVDYASIESGLSTLSSGITNLKTSSTDVAGLGTTIYTELVSPLKDISRDMTAIGKGVINAFATGVKNGMNTLTDAITSIAESVTSGIENKHGDFTSAGEAIATKFSSGITKKGKAAKAAGTTIGAQAVTGAKSKYDSMVGAGEDLGDGLVEGIEAKVDDAYDAGYALGAAAVQGEKDGQQSKSPSKATIKAGRWLGEGLIIGMQNMGKAVNKAGFVMGKGAANTLSNSISKISDIVTNDIDAQPTIRPVMDLGDIRTGAAAINSMLGSESSFGFTANANAVGAMMSRNGQNGVENEVVAAIDKLRHDISNMSNTTYSINGVTYDGTSDVATAIETIARKARMVRRV